MCEINLHCKPSAMSCKDIVEHFFFLFRLFFFTRKTDRQTELRRGGSHLREDVRLSFRRHLLAVRQFSSTADMTQTYIPLSSSLRCVILFLPLISNFLFCVILIFSPFLVLPAVFTPCMPPLILWASIHFSVLAFFLISVLPLLNFTLSYFFPLSSHSR